MKSFRLLLTILSPGLAMLVRPAVSLAQTYTFVPIFQGAVVPWGLTVSGTGSLVVADYGYHTIFKISTTGVASGSATNLAGTAHLSGSADGIGSAARFFSPTSVASDRNGGVYVADTGNHTIRKIAADGTVTTFAGAAGQAGATDGPGSAARFSHPRGVAVDRSGNVYVADSDNHAIRKVGPTGIVTTLAGAKGQPGSTDGLGSAARFAFPADVAVDDRGNVFVSDYSNCIIRKVASDGYVTTLAGGIRQSGSADGTGSDARFLAPIAVAVDQSGNVYVNDGNSDYGQPVLIRKITPAGAVTTLGRRNGGSGGVAVDEAGNLYVSDFDGGLILKGAPSVDAAPVIATQPQSRSVVAGSTAVLSVSATGSPRPSFQWTKDGTVLSGATDATLTLEKVTAASAGTYVCIVTNSLGAVSSASSILTVLDSIPSYSYTFSVLAGSGGNSGSVDGTGEGARFGYAADLSLDRAGNVYVADYGANTLRKITPTGVTTTLVSLNGAYSFSNGTGTIIKFEHPTGVAVDAADSVYIADAGNHAIRKLTVGGAITTVASFSNGLPNSLAVDSTGNIYAADSAINYLSDDSNDVIRKITPNGTITTLAGTAGLNGTADGTGAAARFGTGFSGVAVDRDDNIYIADTGNHTIRKITPGGVVTTFAGQAGSPGLLDGEGGAARFSGPRDVTVDGSGNLFVVDTGNRVIRKISGSGVVTTVADPSANSVRFSSPSSVAVDAAGNLYVAAFNQVLKGVPSAFQSPLVASQTRSQVIAPGGTAVLTVNATGAPRPAYQWRKNGVALSGATNAALLVTDFGPANVASYECLITNAVGSVTSDAIELSTSLAAASGRIVNFSLRTTAGSGEQTLNVGLSLGGGTGFGAPVLLRAIGPSLAAFGVSSFLSDPKLELYAKGTKMGANDDWAGDPQIAAIAAQVGAFPLASSATKEAALSVPSLSAGGYTFVVTGAGTTGGVVLAEVYDATARLAQPSGVRLTNVSARTHVSTGEGGLIAGFVIGGETSRTLLVRAIGPSLAGFGITGLLPDPKLQLYSGTTLLQENDDWSSDPSFAALGFARAGAFPLAAGSKDAAFFVTLPPGAYTAQVGVVGGTTGVALLEIFEIP